MFRKDADFEAFERVMVEAHDRQPIRILFKALLSTWPVERPTNWTARVNAPLTAKELGRIRLSIARGRPYGGDDWVRRTVKEFGLEHTVRPEGRPRKVSQPGTDSAR